jgi:hypothetical protein
MTTQYLISITKVDPELGNITLLEREVSAETVIDFIIDHPAEHTVTVGEATGGGGSAKPSKTATGEKKARLCGNCGKPGHIARKCPNMPDAAAEKVEPMSEEAFDDMRALIASGDFSGVTFADKHKLTNTQINYAVHAETYEEYLQALDQR